MAHSFESDRPEHRVHHLKIHTDHALADSKHDLGNRSPIADQLPPNAGIEMPEMDTNLADEDAEA